MHYETGHYLKEFQHILYEVGCLNLVNKDTGISTDKWHRLKNIFIAYKVKVDAYVLKRMLSL